MWVVPGSQHDVLWFHTQLWMQLCASGALEHIEQVRHGPTMDKDRARGQLTATK